MLTRSAAACLKITVHATAAPPKDLGKLRMRCDASLRALKANPASIKLQMKHKKDLNAFYRAFDQKIKCNVA
jgi:hypothetical protein